MSQLQVSGANTVDPVTNIPVVRGAVLVTETGAYIVTQATGVAAGSLNQLPGTEPDLPDLGDIGLPYGYTEVPDTGTLP